MKKIALSALAAVTLASGIAVPASAAPFLDTDVLLNGFVWQMNLDNDSELDDGAFVVPGTVDSYNYQFGSDYYSETYGDIVDGVTWSVWGNGGSGDIAPTCESADIVTDNATGDIILTCTPDGDFDLNGDQSAVLDYTTEYRFFNVGDNGAVARVSLILTNNSNSAIDFGWQLDQSFGECPEGLTATGSGDTTWQLNDGWVDCASDGTWTDDNDVLYGAEAPSTYAYGHVDAADFPESWSISDDAEPDDDNYIWSDEDADTDYSVIDSGETQIFSYFLATRRGPDVAGAYTTVEEQDLADYSECAFSNGLGSRLLTGLDATPENWVDGGNNDCAFDSPALAETGVDATSGITFGALALAAGVALVFARRRRTV